MLIVFMCFLLLLSSLLSASETGITATSKGYLLQKANMGNGKAKILYNMLQSSEYLITSLLISNTISNVVLTTIATSIFIQHYGYQYISLFAILMTFVLLIFGEVLPKTYALSNANSIALFLSPFIFFINFITKPLSFVFLKISSIMLYMINPQKTDTKISSLYNLRGAIDLLDREDTDNINHEKELLHNMLDLGEISVTDIMNHRKNIICLDLNDKIENKLEEILDSGFSKIPVYTESPENIIGILNVKNMIKYYARNNKPTITDIYELLDNPYFIPDTTYVIDILVMFKKKEHKFALVVDEYGSFMGIVTISDILHKITGILDQISSENRKNDIEKVDNGSYIVAGSYSIRDLNKKLMLNFQEYPFTTVSGLILYETGKIPAKNSVFILHESIFEILEKQNNQITKIKITPTNEKNSNI